LNDWRKNNPKAKRYAEMAICRLLSLVENEDGYVPSMIEVVAEMLVEKDQDFHAELTGILDGHATATEVLSEIKKSSHDGAIFESSVLSGIIKRVKELVVKYAPTEPKKEGND